MVSSGGRTAPAPSCPALRFDNARGHSPPTASLQPPAPLSEQLLHTTAHAKSCPSQPNLPPCQPPVKTAPPAAPAIKSKQASTAHLELTPLPASREKSSSSCSRPRCESRPESMPRSKSRTCDTRLQQWGQVWRSNCVGLLSARVLGCSVRALSLRWAMHSQGSSTPALPRRPLRHRQLLDPCHADSHCRRLPQPAQRLPLLACCRTAPPAPGACSAAAPALHDRTTTQRKLSVTCTPVVKLHRLVQAHAPQLLQRFWARQPLFCRIERPLLAGRLAPIGGAGGGQALQGKGTGTSRTVGEVHFKPAGVNLYSSKRCAATVMQGAAQRTAPPNLWHSGRHAASTSNAARHSTSQHSATCRADAHREAFGNLCRAAPERGVPAQHHSLGLQRLVLLHKEAGQLGLAS